MAQVRIEVDAGITVEVVEGADSSAEVTALQAQVTALTAKVDAAKAYLTALAAADTADDAQRTATLQTLG